MVGDANEPIPPDVRALIGGLDSVAQLEILLLLHRDPSRAWSADDVAGELRIATPAAAEQLDVLCNHGLVACDDQPAKRYRDAPRSPEMSAAVDGLQRAYTERRVTVITMIFTKPQDPLKSFADAFKIRRKDDRDGR